MATDDRLSSTPSMMKRPVSRKHRILTHSQTMVNPRTSRLPTVLSSSDTMHFKRYRSQQKDSLNNASSSKIERQTTIITSQTRLPPLNTSSNDNHPKQRCEYQRRQIYALNHLMRELEQEQFQQFCKLNGIGTENAEEIVSNDEDPNKQPTASE